MTVLALVLYGMVLAVAVRVVWRAPVSALFCFLVGLALHNLAAAFLWDAGVRGNPLDLILAWKEILLATALARVAFDAWRARRLPFQPRAVDALALAFALVATLYALIPQAVLDGEAGREAILYGLRHALVPVAAYLLGRSLVLGSRDLRRLGWTIFVVAGAVGLFGLADLYTLDVEWWSGSGAVGYFGDQLGFDLHGPGRLPENFAFNTDEGVFRRLVSTFISPLGTAFVLVVALLLAASPGRHWRRRALLLPLGAVLVTALLFTLSRSAVIALAAGLVLLALARRSPWHLAGAALVLAAGFWFAVAFPSIAPETHFFPADLVYQEEQARLKGGLPEETILSPGDPSIRSHLSSLRAGLERVARHPQGYGLGNAGATARRFDEPLKAGESNYAEIGVETGLLGLALFLAWNLALLAGLIRQARNAPDEDVRWAAGGVAAALGAILVLAVQTDAYGVPWLAYGLWWICGALLLPVPALAAARRATTAGPA